MLLNFNTKFQLQKFAKEKISIGNPLQKVHCQLKVLAFNLVI